MMNPANPSRRHFLRGAGVALALPWMESLQLLRAQDGAAAAASAANQPPLRFACGHNSLCRRVNFFEKFIVPPVLMQILQ